MRHIETTPGMGGWGINENDGRVNSTIIHCENFCNVTIVTPIQQ
jgi:hypothetical protein